MIWVETKEYIKKTYMRQIDGILFFVIIWILGFLSGYFYSRNK